MDSTPSQIRRVTLIGEEGSRTELIRYEYDEAGRLSAVIDGSKQPFRYWYDSENRDDTLARSGAHLVSIDHDSQGRCVAVEGAEGMYAAEFQYDVAPKTNQVEDSNGVTILTYNDYLQVVRQVDPRKGVTTTVWDERSNKLEDGRSGRPHVLVYVRCGWKCFVCHRSFGTDHAHPIRCRRTPDPTRDPALRAWIRRYDNRGNLIASASRLPNRGGINETKPAMLRG